MYPARPFRQGFASAVFAKALGVLFCLCLSHTNAWSQTATQYRFAVEPGPLEAALMQFSSTTGFTTSFTPDLVAGKTSSGVKGSFTAAEALRALLSGSGLQAWQLANGSFSIVLQEEGAGVLPAVKVRASSDPLPGELPEVYAGGQVAKGARVGVFGDRDVMEVPFSVVPFSRETIDNQQARTVVEVLRNDASVNINQNTNSGGTDDVWNIRGFLGASGSATFNGLAGLGGRSQAIEAIERIELLKGPTAFVNGAPGLVVGGTVNYVTKRAGVAPVTQLTTRYYTDSVLGAHADVARRYGEAKEWGVRFNGAYRKGDTPLDNTHKENRVGAIALDYFGESVRVLADLEYSLAATDGFLGGTTVAAGVPIPSAPRNTNNWGQAWGEYPQEKKRAVLRAEWDFHSGWTASAAYGQLDQRDGDYIYCGSEIISVTGDVSYADNCYRGGTQGDFDSTEVKIAGRVETGSVAHRLVLGATRTMSEFAGPFEYFTIPNSTGSNIHNPIQYPRPSIPEVSYLGKYSDSIIRTLFVGDELGLIDERLLITLGLRRVEFDFGNFDEITGVGGPRTTKAANTPGLGALYKLTPTTSVYTNYAEALEQGGTAPNNGTVDNPGAVIEPLRSKQVEIGTKFDFGSFATTLAFFEIQKANTTIVDRIFGNFGEQVNRGAEAAVFGEPTKGLRVLSGLTWIDAEQTKTQGGLTDGKTAVGVPEFQARLGSEWDLPFAPGVTLTGHVAHSSKSYLDASNSRHIPDWTRFDTGLRYATRVGGKATFLRLNVENLTDKDYWGSVDRGNLYSAQPRTVSLSATIDF